MDDSEDEDEDIFSNCFVAGSPFSEQAAMDCLPVESTTSVSSMSPCWLSKLKTLIMGNDLLFSGHPSYMHEIASLSKCILQNFVSFIEQEPSKASRGRLALEACNCIASSFNVGSSNS